MFMINPNYLAEVWRDEDTSYSSIEFREEYSLPLGVVGIGRYPGQKGMFFVNDDGLLNFSGRIGGSDLETNPEANAVGFTFVTNVMNRFACFTNFRGAIYVGVEGFAFTGAPRALIFK